MKTVLTKIHQLSHIALAIRTAPSRALHEYAPQTREDITRLMARAQASEPGLTYEQFASCDPMFGKIICISAGYIIENPDGDPVMRLKSYTGSEDEQLTCFMHDCARFPNIFIHMNKRTNDAQFMPA